MQPRAQSGVTLVELLVASILGSFLLIMAMMAWRPASAEALSVRDRARSGAELRLAVEALLQDLGGADSALPGPDGELVIKRLQPLAERLGAWSAGDDDGIEWWLQDGKLHRQDLELNTDVILAAGLTGLLVTRDAGETHIRLEAGAGDDARSVELAWIQ
ncbi:MAG TPA: prepilin-type N-terminal cleavage/methylation domain-containing protein [Planctomycetota bacterium]|nr:prepilin-type N-terminal cleavage/methylation domain-containing protein [Planctomycetota bacterium]